MATKFETYRAESRYKRQPLDSSKLKTLDQLLNEARAVKEKRALEEQYRFEVNNQQKALDEQRFAEEQQQQEQTNQPTNQKWYDRIIPTIQEGFGRLGQGFGSSIEGMSDAPLDLADTLQYNLLKAKSGFYDILGNKSKANMYDIQANAINDITSLNKPSATPDEKMFVVGTKIEEKSRTFANKYDQESYLKGIGQEVAVSVGSMLPSITLGMVSGGALGLPSLGLQAFGGSSEQALEEGATINQATAYGALSSAKEVITEKLVGGGLGKLTGYTGMLDNVLGKVVTTKFGKLAVDILGEGLEEALAEGLEPTIKGITYDKTAFKDYGDEEYWKGVGQAAIIGGLTGAIFDGANAVIRKGTNADVKDIVKEYEHLDKVEQAKTQDKSLTEEEAKEIAKMKIDLQKQLDAKLNKMSVSQRLNFIGKNADNPLVVDYANKNDGFGVNKGTYTSKPLTNQQLGIQEEEVAPVEETPKPIETTETVKEEIKVVETPKVDLVSEKPSIKEAEDFYKVVKEINPNAPKVVYDDTVGDNVNGYYNRNTNTLVINPNVEKPATAILKHEITHSLEKTNYYTKLKEYAIKYLKSKGEYDALVKEITENYSEQIKALTGQELQDYIDTEVISHFSERLFSDQESINQLVKDNRSLAKKIYDFIKGLIAKISGNTTEKAQLQKIEQMYKKALEEESATAKKEEVKKDTVSKDKALEKEMESAFLEELEEDYKEEQTIKAELEKEVVEPKKVVKEVKKEKPPVAKAKPGSKVENYYTLLGKWEGKKLKDVAEPLKNVRVLNCNVDDILYAKQNGFWTAFDKNTGLKSNIGYIKTIEELIANVNSNKDRIIKIRESESYQNQLTRYKTALAERKELEAEWEKNAKELEAQEEDTTPIQPKNMDDISDIKQPVYKTKTKEEIAQDKWLKEQGKKALKNVKVDENTKFSLNSRGEKLSPKQQEFFKDSKVRDEQGKLQVVYHGTNADFVVFNDNNNDLAQKGFYFSDKKEVAESYKKYSEQRIVEAYINLINPLIVEGRRRKWNKIELEVPSKSFDWYEIKQDSYGNWRIYNLDGMVTIESTVAYKTKEDAESNYNKKGNEIYHSMPKKLNTTRDITKFAYAFGHDGVIFKNIYDMGDKNVEQKLSTVVVAFKSNLIKSIENLNPSESDDIRYSKTKETKFQTTVLEAQKGNLNKATTDMVKTNPSLYEVDTNKRQVENAQETLKGKRVDTQIDLYIKKLSNRRENITADDIAIIEQLILSSDAKGFFEESAHLTRLLSQRASEMGQSIQALSIIQKLSPKGKLLAWKKIIDSSNSEINFNKPNYTNSKVFKEISKERMKKWYDKDLRVIKALAVKRLISNHEGLLLTNQEIDRLVNLTHTSKGYENNVKETLSKHIKDNVELDSITKEFVEDIKTNEEKLITNYNTNPVLIPLYLAEQLTNAETDANLKETMKSIETLVESQKVASFFDKINAWRYLSMLGNAKTHIRNIVSNSVMAEVVDAKSFVSRAIQTVFVKKENRTRTFKRVSNEMVEYGKEMYDVAIDEIQAESKFYEARSKKQIFRNKLLERFRKFNFLMLGKEDLWFIKPRFSKEFGEWATAKGYSQEFLTKNDDIRLEGITYAMEQAQKATFNDTCKLVTRLNALKSSNKLVGILVDAVLPFTKTPINIARRAFEYSPIGLVKTLSVDIVKLKQGKLNVSQFIENISSGLVGSGITLLGLFLAKLGIMSGGDDENKKKGAYDQTIGEQSFSIKILDKTYSLDWLAPSSIPLFMGVSLYNAVKNQDENDLYGIIGTMLSALDPMTEMTVLRSFNSAMSTYDDSKLYGFVSNAMQSYAGQFLPTLGSQIAKIIDTERKTTASTNQGVYTRNMERFWSYLQSKVPFFASDLEPYIDVWGNVDKNPSWEMRLLENTVFPFYVESIKSNNPVDLEIMRLYETLGSSDVLPSSPNYYYTKNGEKIYLDEEQYTQFKKDVGQFSKTQLNALFKSTVYKSLSDEEKAKAISRVYDYARDYAKKQDTYLLSSVLGDSHTYLLSTFQLQLDTISSKTDEFGNVIVNSKKDQVMAYINALPLSKIQKHLLFAEAGYNNSTDIDLVRNYVYSLSNLTKEQKEQLFQMFKYD